MCSNDEFQALKHLKNYISLFSAFTSSAKSEMVLCNKVQEYCYDNQNFLKCFNKIVLLFYKTEVLSEEVILKWYKDGHAPKGWTVFMDQMKKFIDWLEQAESGMDTHIAFSVIVVGVGQFILHEFLFGISGFIFTKLQ